MDIKKDEKSIKKGIKLEIRPWGNFKQFAYNEKCTVKIITVKEGQILSKQRHKNRDELWVVIDMGLKVELDDKVIEPRIGDEIVIPRNTMHRLSSMKGDGRILEISFGEFDEADIERFDDIYGRC